MISIYRGDSATVNIEVRDQYGELLDLSSKEITLMVKRSLSDLDSQAFFSISNVGIDPKITVMGIGEAVALLETEKTKNESEGQFFYDVKVAWLDGTRQRRKTVAQSVFVVKPVVNRGEST